MDKVIVCGKEPYSLKVSIPVKLVGDFLVEFGKNFPNTGHKEEDFEEEFAENSFQGHVLPDGDTFQFILAVSLGEIEKLAKFIADFNEKAACKQNPTVLEERLGTGL